MMKKRLLALLACGAMAATSVMGFVGCGKKDDKGKLKLDKGTYNLTVWAPQVQQEWLGEVVGKFKTQFPDSTFNITLGVCAEGSAFENVRTDPTAAANVYAFASDQTADLLALGALARIGGDKLDYLKATNDEGSVAAAKLGEGYYGYPFAADNGYVLFYNKSVITKTEKLDDILSQAQAAGKYMTCAFNSGFYVPAWFFGAGCDYSAEYNNKGELIKLSTDFGDATKGTVAAKAMIQMAAHPAFRNGKDSVAISGFEDGSVVAAVQDLAKAVDFKRLLGDNFAATKLPQFTVDGKDYQMGSFAGYKLYGVNAASTKTDDLPAAHALAAFLTSEEIQKERFDKFNIGPSNKNVQNTDAVKNDPTQKAFYAQLPYAKPQLPIPKIFWDSVKAFGTEVKDKKITVENISEKLAKMVADMDSVNPK